MARKRFTSEEITRGSMHTTNKSFERYYKVELEGLLPIYEDTDEKKKGEVVNLRRKESTG